VGDNIPHVVRAVEVSPLAPVCRDSLLFGSIMKHVLALLILPLALSIAASNEARSQQGDAAASVRALNEAALEAYELLEPEEARRLLNEALEAGRKQGLQNDPETARAHVLLGVVLAGAFEEDEAAFEQFQKGLQIQPTVRIDDDLRNPNIDAAFERALTQLADQPVAESYTEVLDDNGNPRPGPPFGFAGLFHKPLASAVVGERLVITAAVEQNLPYRKLVLSYKPEGASGYLTRELEREPDGWWTARIPPPAVRGKSVNYFLQLLDAGGTPLATSGSESEPHVVALESYSANDASDTDEENPFDSQPKNRSAPLRGRWFARLAVGSGMGVANGNAEFSPDEDGDPIGFEGSAPAGTLVVSPEVGYFVSSRVFVSLQVRSQLLLGTSSAKINVGDSDERLASPASMAHAGFVRAGYYFLDGAFRPYAFVSAGAGEARFIVDIGDFRDDCGDAPEGESGSEDCIDSVVAGPVFAGAGGGLELMLTDTIGLNATVSVIADVLNMPDLNLAADFGGGVVVVF